MTSLNSAIAEKRDLHVGGLGIHRRAAAAPIVEDTVDSVTDASEYLLRKVRDVVRSTDGVVRDNPWTVAGVAALVGLTAGYFLSRRS